MILLRANHELEEVFKRLIQTMKINVIWTGLFAVVDNYLILQGEVRSLFFDFENRRVVTNIIDIPVNAERYFRNGGDLCSRRGHFHDRRSYRVCDQTKL